MSSKKKKQSQLFIIVNFVPLKSLRLLNPTALSCSRMSCSFTVKLQKNLSVLPDKPENGENTLADWICDPGPETG